jgi:hypothetical protein
MCVRICEEQDWGSVIALWSGISWQGELDMFE